jgi:hypothetical protein
MPAGELACRDPRRVRAHSRRRAPRASSARRDARARDRTRAHRIGAPARHAIGFDGEQKNC